jgi:hypothetical protein
MKEAYSRSIERETPNGLLILKAVYGSLPQQLQNIESASDKMINVTVPLQVLVKDHSLQILSDSTKVSWKTTTPTCHSKFEIKTEQLF